MIGSVEAQKQSIIKKIVTMHTIFLHILEMYSIQQVEILGFQKPNFPIDFYRDDCISLCFCVRFQV